MSIVDIIKNENNNKSLIYLYKDGFFWRAYNKSAMRFISHIKNMKILVRCIKSLDNQMIYYCGFPDTSLQKIKDLIMIKKFTINTENSRYIEICLGNVVDDFEIWKLKYSIEEKKSNLYYNLKIYKSTYDLNKKIIEYIKDVTREYKYTLAQECRKKTMDMIIDIYKINKNIDKKIYFDGMLEKIEYIKVYFRLLYDFHQINDSKFAQLSINIDDINKQTINWRNSFNK